MPAGAWERDILPLRVKNYVPSDLDKLCAAGRIAWVPAGRGERQRNRAGGWAGAIDAHHAGRSERRWRIGSEARRRRNRIEGLSARAHENPGEPAPARRVVLRRPRARHRAAAQRCRDGPRRARQPRAGDVGFVRGRSRADHVQEAARAAAPISTAVPEPGGCRAVEPAAARCAVLATQMRSAHPAVDHIARVLLRRYGVVFRKLLERESGLPPWRELFYVYRRMEARGEIRGGRFVSGFAGEQFALPEAVDLLRGVARETSWTSLDLRRRSAEPGRDRHARRARAALSGNRVLFEQACRSRCRPEARCDS